MTRIYLAGPLFCQSERDYNIRLKDALSQAGYELILPQDNDFKINTAKMAANQDYRDAATMMVFQADMEMLDSCDAVIFNMDGRVPDEGGCVEIGYAYAKGKECFGLKTDVRTAEFGTDNMMIGGVLKLRVAASISELIGFLKESGL